jgi:hypothetical protein
LFFLKYRDEKVLIGYSTASCTSIVLSISLIKKGYKITGRRKMFRVCLDGERISERITLFGLVVENNVRLVISREM